MLSATTGTGEAVRAVATRSVSLGEKADFASKRATSSAGGDALAAFRAAERQAAPTAWGTHAVAFGVLEALTASKASEAPDAEEVAAPAPADRTPRAALCAAVLVGVAVLLTAALGADRPLICVSLPISLAVGWLFWVRAGGYDVPAGMAQEVFSWLNIETPQRLVVPGVRIPSFVQNAWGLSRLFCEDGGWAGDLSREVLDDPLKNYGASLVASAVLGRLYEDARLHDLDVDRVEGEDAADPQRPRLAWPALGSATAAAAVVSVLARPLSVSSGMVPFAVLAVIAGTACCAAVAALSARKCQMTCGFNPSVQRMRVLCRSSWYACWAAIFVGCALRAVFLGGVL